MRRSRRSRPRRAFPTTCWRTTRGWSATRSTARRAFSPRATAAIPSSTEKNNAKLLEELTRANAATPQQRAARYRCVLVLAREGALLASFDGVCEGTIALAAKGTNGFGYDPLFIPQGYARSFGQLTDKTKAHLSHRAQALKKFVAWCKENPLE